MKRSIDLTKLYKFKFLFLGFFLFLFLFLNFTSVFSQNKEELETKINSKNTDISTLDSSKKYTAHKLTKKYPEKKRSTSSLAKTKSASLKPYQGCFHRCFACCNQL